MLVTVIVAPGTTPPPVSLTTPLSVARSTCATAAGTCSRNTAARISMPCSVRFMKAPPRLTGKSGSSSSHERQARIGRRPLAAQLRVAWVVARGHRPPAARQDVQVVGIVAVRCDERVIAVAHCDDVAVRHAQRLVAAVGVQALKAGRGRLAVAVVINLVEIGLPRRIVDVW